MKNRKVKNQKHSETLNRERTSKDQIRQGPSSGDDQQPTTTLQTEGRARPNPTCTCTRRPRRRPWRRTTGPTRFDFTPTTIRTPLGLIGPRQWYHGGVETKRCANFFRVCFFFFLFLFAFVHLRWSWFEMELILLDLDFEFDFDFDVDLDLSRFWFKYMLLFFISISNMILILIWNRVLFFSFLVVFDACAVRVLGPFVLLAYEIWPRSHKLFVS